MLDLAMENVEISFPGLASPVLDIGRLAIASGSRVAISGASGSGKSTFVNLVTGLERLRRGRIEWSGTDLGRLSESGRDRWRGANVGLVMQDFHLFAGLSAFDNVLLPARLASAASAALSKRATELLNRVGLRRPGQDIETMSRGEMQRVAIARALLRNPGIIVADEPTASLDPEAGAAAGDLLLALSRDNGSTLIVVSHDRRLTERLDRQIVLDGGRVISDSHAGAGV